MDPNENIPKKMSFMDRLRFLFSGNNPVVDQMAARIQELEGEVEDLKSKNSVEDKKAAEEEAERRRIEREKENERRKEEAEKKKEETKGEVERLRQDTESGDKENPENEEIPDYTLKNYLREQLIREKMKLDDSLAQMDIMGGSNGEKLESIKKYQAKVLGILYAYTEYDHKSAPDVVKVFQDKIRSNAMEMDENGRRSFIDGYMHTRFQSCYYDDRDWERYVNNPFFSGGELSSPLSDGRMSAGYYAERITFRSISDKLPSHKEVLPNDKFYTSSVGELVQTTKEVSGYGVKETFEPKDGDER